MVVQNLARGVSIAVTADADGTTALTTVYTNGAAAKRHLVLTVSNQSDDYVAVEVYVDTDGSAAAATLEVTADIPPRETVRHGLIALAASAVVSARADTASVLRASLDEDD